MKKSYEKLEMEVTKFNEQCEIFMSGFADGGDTGSDEGDF